MSNEIAIFNEAVKEQMPMLVKATNLKQEEIYSKLESFAYETKQMLEKSHQSLANLDAQSIREAFKASIDTGIPVDKRCLSYVIKYGNSLQYHIGFKGFIFKIKEIYPNSSIKAELVYKDDLFQVEKADGQAKYTHKIGNPFNSKIEDIVGVYAFIQYTDKDKTFSFIETMGKEEIEKIKSKAKTGMVWKDWYGEMAKKAVIRRLCKTLCIGNPNLSILEDIDNDNFELNKKKDIEIDYSKTIDMPQENNNKADIEEKTEEQTEEKKEIIKEQDLVVEQEIQNDTITEQGIDNIFIVKDCIKKSGTNKNGKSYTLTTLVLDDSTNTKVKTFDKKDYRVGQTVELIGWNKETNMVEKINIL